VFDILKQILRTMQNICFTNIVLKNVKNSDHDHNTQKNGIQFIPVRSSVYG